MRLSLGTILLIILIIILLGGFSGLGRGPFYGTGYYGGGGLGLVIVILLILVLVGSSEIFCLDRHRFRRNAEGTVISVGRGRAFLPRRPRMLTLPPIACMCAGIG